jgi:uncharacterized protein YbaR (Trm112 family)/ubiquinone/menaquinone biosynthesis C-methylase UbiE
MREEVLRWIICPDCGGELTCHPDERDPSSPHILEGRLSCASCRQNYPIIHGVPRLLPSEAGTRAKNETQEKFGFEWTQFKDYSVDNFTAFIHPLPVGYFNKKLGLDAGCGAGRHSCRAQALGAHRIGLDLSPAVHSAFESSKNMERIHIVQGDIEHPPFRPGTFDFVYSLGVLQHLSDPKGGYLCLVPLLKRGGDIFIWVYQKRLRKILLEMARIITKRLPPPLISITAFLFTLVDYGIFCTLFRLLSKFNALRPFCQKIFPARTQEYAGYSFRNNWTDWYDRLAAPITHFYDTSDITSWLREASLEKVEVNAEGDSWIWAIGRRGPISQ